MSDALILVVLGMGTVFILLYVINIMIVVLGKLLGPKSKAAPAETKAQKAETGPAAEAAGGEDEGELAVLFAAAVAAYMGVEPNRIRLVVRPVKTSDAWAQAGRMENSL